MRQTRFRVAITIDYRFVLAIAVSLVLVVGTVLLLKK